MTQITQYSDDSLLIKIVISRRFTTYRRPDGKTELRFGAGVSDSKDEDIIPNPDNVGSNLPDSPSKIYETFDPSNFLKTKTYGLASSTQHYQLLINMVVVFKTMLVLMKSINLPVVSH